MASRKRKTYQTEPSYLLSWSLKSPLSTNMAISERSGVDSYPYPVKESQRYINLNPGRLFVQQPPKKGKKSTASFKLLRQRLQ